MRPRGRDGPGPRPWFGLIGLGADSSERTAASIATGVGVAAARRSAQKWANDWPGNGEFSPWPITSTTVAGRSRRLTNPSTTPRERRRSAGKTINNGTWLSAAIQALAVIEQPVLPKALAMIGGHDHQRLIEHTAAVEVVDQLTQPVVHIGQAVVVTIARERPLRGGNADLSARSQRIGQEGQLGIGRLRQGRSGTSYRAEGRRANGRRYNSKRRRTDAEGPADATTSRETPDSRHRPLFAPTQKVS